MCHQFVFFSIWIKFIYIKSFYNDFKNNLYFKYCILLQILAFYVDILSSEGYFLLSSFVILLKANAQFEILVSSLSVAQIVMWNYTLILNCIWNCVQHILHYSLLVQSDCNVSLHITLELIIHFIHTVFQVLRANVAYCVKSHIDCIIFGIISQLFGVALFPTVSF